MRTVAETHLADATIATMDLLEKRTARCEDCTLSTYNLRRFLMKRLAIHVNASKLLVPLVIEILLGKDIIEFWDQNMKGIIYRVKAARVREIVVTL